MARHRTTHSYGETICYIILLAIIIASPLIGIIVFDLRQYYIAQGTSLTQTIISGKFFEGQWLAIIDPVTIFFRYIFIWIVIAVGWGTD
jgi:hypothetical protein